MLVFFVAFTYVFLMGVNRDDNEGLRFKWNSHGFLYGV